MDRYHSIVWPMVSYHWKTIGCNGCHRKTIETNGWWNYWKTSITILWFDKWLATIENHWIQWLINKNHWPFNHAKKLTIATVYCQDTRYGLRCLLREQSFKVWNQIKTWKSDATKIELSAEFNPKFLTRYYWNQQIFETDSEIVCTKFCSTPILWLSKIWKSLKTGKSESDVWWWWWWCGFSITGC